jgi:pimeloyl-ACP methyl ester carboxylesterase
MDKPTMQAFAAHAWKALCEAGVVPKRPSSPILAAAAASSPRKVVLLGHSLGGHVVAEMAASAPPDAGADVLCTQLLAPVCVRPHRGIGDEKYYPWVQFFGLKAEEKPFYSVVIPPMLRVVFRLIGFPKGLSTSLIVFVQQRVAHIDFERFRYLVTGTTSSSSSGSSSRSSSSGSTPPRPKVSPIVHMYAKDDNLIQHQLQEELARLLPADTSTTIVWESGGHNVQKSRCKEIVEHVCRPIVADVTARK